MVYDLCLTYINVYILYLCSLSLDSVYAAGRELHRFRIHFYVNVFPHYIHTFFSDRPQENNFLCTWCFLCFTRYYVIYIVTAMPSTTCVYFVKLIAYFPIQQGDTLSSSGRQSLCLQIIDVDSFGSIWNFLARSDLDYL